MNTPFIELTEDELDQRFTFVPNHLNTTAGWVYGGNRGCLFETYGDELAFVQRQDKQHVWTVVDSEHGDMYILSGFHQINRVGYLISQHARPDNVAIQIRLLMQSDEVLEEPGDQS
jgi:hypothetical protein